LKTLGVKRVGDWAVKDEKQEGKVVKTVVIVAVAY
jgi:hypothetical protein